MITKTVLDALQEQLMLELATSQMYLSMATWCEHENLPGCAALLLDHANEERDHMMKIITYLQECDIRPMIEALEAPRHEYDSALDVFEAVYDREMAVTENINKISALTLESKDFSAFNFIQYFVADQHTGLVMFRDIRDMARGLNFDNFRERMYFDKNVRRILEGLQVEEVAGFTPGG
jgi:ferritin